MIRANPAKCLGSNKKHFQRAGKMRAIHAASGLYIAIVISQARSGLMHFIFSKT